MELAKKHQDRLPEIKANIESWFAYFKDNIRRYHEYMNFVFKTCLTDAERDKLAELNKPALEFNILEALISRLRGEFAKQEPSIAVRAGDGVRVEQLDEEFIKRLEIIEAHIRATLFDATNDHFGYNVYTEQLGGGFSVAHIYTDYVNDMSFEQNIFVERAYDPTLAGFDPLARDSHKGDGRFCFHLYPKTKEEFIEEFGADALKDVRFQRDEKSDFSWSYKNQDQEIMMVAEYFEKKNKKTTIVKLTNGETMTKEQYQEALQQWEAEGIIEQPPLIVEQRTSLIEAICRYLVCGNKVLDYIETKYKYLPLVFIDGNSVNIKDSASGAAVQMTRPYVYHAMGVQKLKNFAGQTVAAEMENMVMHKFKVSVEAIPEKYQDAYANPQQADVLVYNAFYKGDPNIQLMPPMEIQRTQTPPIVENTFMGSDQVTQTILGSYDAQLGISGNQISGTAIQQGAMQSNAAAMPYLMGYIKGLNRIAQIQIDLIPKYYRNVRSLPVRKSNGKRDLQVINHPTDETSIDMDYDANDLQIKVEAGVNSAVQKQVALDQIIRMMQSSEIFAQFINTKGLETILDNMDIRGIDGLKEQALKFMQELEQQQAESANQPDIMEKMAEDQKEIEFARIEQRAIQAEGQNAIATAKVAIEQEKVDLAHMELMARIENDVQKTLIEQEKVDAENARSAIDTAINFSKHNREEVDIFDPRDFAE